MKSFKQNKQAFTQPKNANGQWGKDPFERSAREERRRNQAKLKSSGTKEQRLGKELLELVNQAWKEERYIPELKKVKFTEEFSEWALSHRSEEYEKIKGKEVEFEGFEVVTTSIWSSSYLEGRKIYIRCNNTVLTLPKVMFKPLITNEDLVLYIMKREIGL